MTLQEAAAEVARDQPDRPRFRAGVNSGEVVAGVVGGSRGTASTASSATPSTWPPGSSRGARGPRRPRRRTGGRLPPGAIVERLPELRVKGKPEPVDAYVLRSLDDTMDG